MKSPTRTRPPGELIATRGRVELIAVGQVKPNDMASKGRIYDPATGQVSGPMPVQQVLKWGYWEPPPRSGSKAKKRTSTGGRWRTLRDGRRVYVTREENV